VNKSLWRIAAFPIFAVFAAFFVPTICALASVGYLPSWALVILLVASLSWQPLRLPWRTSGVAEHLASVSPRALSPTLSGGLLRPI
jgi:hypothetical protein